MAGRRLRAHDRHGKRMAGERDARRLARLGGDDDAGPRGPEQRFPSAFPKAPEAYDGIARTLSRGLGHE